MLRRSLFVGWCGLAGCSDAAGPEPFDLRTMPAALSVISGDAQSDTIGAMLTQPITVRLVAAEDSTPVAGASVSFVVVQPGCGRPFAGSAITNQDGRASERWELGTKAGSCTMEARAVDVDGTPRVLASVTSTVRPGAPHSVSFNVAPVTMFLGNSLDTAALLTSATDRAGNATTAALSVEGPLSASTERSDTLTLSAGGTSAQKPVSWIADHSNKKWSLDMACANPFVTAGGGPLDSVVVTATADSLQYSGNGLRMRLTGSVTWYSRGGSTRDTIAIKTPVRVIQQPGRLDQLTATDNPPTEYTGSLCGSSLFLGWSPLSSSSYTAVRPTILGAQ